METVRAFLFISFMYWTLKTSDSTDNQHEQKGEENIKRSLEMSPDGILPNALKAWMLFEKRDFVKYEDLCKKLDILSNNKARVLEANSVLAFCYCRMGMEYYEKAILIYDKLLGEANQMAAIGRTNAFETLWRFGLGLILRRLLNVETISEMDVGDWSKRAQRAAKLFHQLVNETENETYKARSFVQLGMMAENINNLSDGCKEISLINLFPPELHDKPVQYFYEQAESYTKQVQDVFLLERCGEFYRKSNLFEKAKSCFETALEIRKTSFSLHHLALTLKSTISQRHAPMEETISNMKSLTLEETQIQKILAMLDEAYDLNEDPIVLNDKGCMLIELRRFTEATHILAKVDRDSCYKASQIQEAISLKLQAYCVLESLHIVTDEHQKAAKWNVIVMLMKALERMTPVEKEVPALNGRWEVFEMLKNLMNDHENNEEHLITFCKASIVVGLYKQSIFWLETFIEQDPSADPKPAILRVLIDAHIEMKYYSMAICEFDKLVLVDRDQIDHNKYIEAHIMGAFEALANSKMDHLVEPRIRNAFDFGNEAIPKGQFDIFVYCPCGDHQSCSQVNIYGRLEKCKLKVTMKEANGRPGQPSLDYFKESLWNSRHFLIVAEGNEDFRGNEFTNMIFRSYEVSQKAKRIVFVKKEGTCIPDEFHNCPSVGVPPIDIADTTLTLSKTACDWASRLILKFLWKC